MIPRPPPIIGLLIALLLGVLIGGIITHQHYQKRALKAVEAVRSADNQVGRQISKETQDLREKSTLKETITIYVDKPVPFCPELEDHEIEAMCVTRFAPNDIVQSIRDQVSRARRRFDCL